MNNTDGCITDFEQEIFCDKQKMSANEAFFFKAGIHAALISPQVILSQSGPTEAAAYVRGMMDEAKIFEHELKAMHSMYCDNCSNHNPIV